MDFAYDERTEELRARVAAFMDEFVYPAEPIFAEQVEPRRRSRGPSRRSSPTLQAQARERGLWNLFLPGTRAGPG